MIRRPPRSTLFPTRRSSDLKGRLPEPAVGEVPGHVARRCDVEGGVQRGGGGGGDRDRKSTRLNSSHSQISYAVFCLKKKKIIRVGAMTGVPPLNVAVGVLSS